MTDDKLDEFFRELSAEVEEAVNSTGNSAYSEEEFTRIILDRLGEEGVLDNPIPLYQEGTFVRTKYKITGYSVPDTEDRCLLVTTVYTGSERPRDLTTEEMKIAVTQAANFYKCSCDGLHNKIEPANTEASDLARRINEIQQSVEVLRIVLISDGITKAKTLDIRDTKNNTRVIADIYGLVHLQRILGAGLTRDDIVVEIQNTDCAPLSCLKVSGEDCDYNAYLTALPATLLADVYEKYGTRLLELNVRAFLGVRGRKSINAGLRRTIIDEPEHFLAYNNGIVATADDLVVEQNNKGETFIRTLRGLQIVNGGQTTASLHRAKRQDKISLNKILVPAKIIQIKTGDLNTMVSAISRSANSQNTIQPADFSANDPFHTAVENLANNVWLPNQAGRWFYERARGSYSAAEAKASFKAAEKRRFASETPKDRRFAKTDLAKYINVWDGLPHIVSLGNQKNFQYFMQGLKDKYPDGLIPDEVWFKEFVAKAIIFRVALAIVRKKKFPAYQANITAYVVSYLVWRFQENIDLAMVWQNQCVSDEFANMIDDWTTSIDGQLRSSAQSKMPSEWAKKSDCWEAFKKITLDIPEIMPRELSRWQSGRS